MEIRTMASNEANSTTEAQSADKQADLEGSVKVGGQNIEAVADDSDREILGWVVPFTIGNDFIVPRSWLETRASDLGLSHAVLPSKTSKKRAFTRAGGFVEDRNVAGIEQENENVEIHLEKVKYEYEYRVEVHDRRQENEFDGEMIAYIGYDSETESLNWNPRIKPEHEMWQAAQDYIGAFRDEWDLQQKSNTGRDIRSMITRFFTTRSQSVKFRAGGGVYFAPVAAEEVVKAFDTLVSDINSEHKKSGFPCELDTIEVADSDEKKSMVEEKVRRDLERQVSELIEDAIDNLADEDTLVDDLIGDIENELDDVEGFAGQYNALLDAEMTVREYLEDWKTTTTGEAEDLVEEVLDGLEDDDSDDYDRVI